MTTFKEYLRLDELSGVNKRLTQLSPEEAVEFIKSEFAAGKTKLRPLGKGALGVALTNGTDVFKFWYQDGAYERYANFCIGNDSPWLPKFKSKVRTLPRFIKIDGNKADIRYVKMELLQPFKSDFLMKIWTDPDIIKQIGGDKNNLTNVDQVFRWARASKKPRGVLKWLLNGHKEEKDIQVDVEQFLADVNPQLLSLIDTVVQIVNILGDDDRLDLDEDGVQRNMAMRGNQPVILDPIVNDDDIRINNQINGFLL